VTSPFKSPATWSCDPVAAEGVREEDALLRGVTVRDGCAAVGVDAPQAYRDPKARTATSARI
jgi:hypothetical protein